MCLLGCDILLCTVQKNKIKMVISGSISPQIGCSLGEPALAPMNKWSTHTAHTTKAWTNQWELWKSSKKNLSTQNLSQRDMVKKQFVSYTVSSLQKIHGFVPGYKHLTDEATITIKLEEELVAFPVLGKNPSFLVPCRSWSWCHLYLKN